ncbi:hypothetical protein CC1G_01497 [Coprinopsis cinerea okayama7|uniref:Uncharacterized protein n=1 Tax=Coprinopsis cinerea (strain Okayama-7 / 130 / ATCC MYA-4618 / FGSC 9003) TaxID=240176 RepID=A8NHT0_COPC7|nr:hypothetical protein CC1G_01497 [Coprinopsis cinerea okayama7\|eukprot:XP_001833820.2 hypothetical protein CC1G_01497 [Coprinopsis cinerea okayama7\
MTQTPETLEILRNPEFVFYKDRSISVIIAWRGLQFVMLSCALGAACQNKGRFRNDYTHLFLLCVGGLSLASFTVATALQANVHFRYFHPEFEEGKNLGDLYDDYMGLVAYGRDYRTIGAGVLFDLCLVLSNLTVLYGRLSPRDRPRSAFVPVMMGLSSIEESIQSSYTPCVPFLYPRDEPIPLTAIRLSFAFYVESLNPFQAVKVEIWAKAAVGHAITSLVHNCVAGTLGTGQG